MSEHNMNVWILKTNGSAVLVKDAPFTYYKDTGWELSLDWAKKQIGNGCTIAELVRLPWGDLWIDEEGLFREERNLNGFATSLYQAAFGGGNPIVGNAVLVMKKNAKMNRELAHILTQLVAKSSSTC
ncbi:MAG: hypothetical protein JRG69_01850 [Deltaproteobacteria bacterium]|nr:hypothetical protein [Deltaproteobacteria bacterium]